MRCGSLYPHSASSTWAPRIPHATLCKSGETLTDGIRSHCFPATSPASCFPSRSRNTPRRRSRFPSPPPTHCH
ncbi:unnamed protein product [Chondrus crispus]|uniref:Uncharacterized protein n=1 Tax=Chondrus crispus TaxID=2769 RepID=R7QJ46_CHOCR|nr:unnamed protein product [Chondrus crispus]CDF38114.1 unnamed protein product [Chondrus crispus]|eukprot:XP_005717983.1 unnamed protein product [Chondrus crispus]